MKKQAEKIELYNTLTRKEETFKPIKKNQVSMYSCGPTVYWYQHIGNLRTAIMNDLIKRTFMHAGYKVKHVMNITDVDDKTIKASIREKISLSQLTRKYEEIFLENLQELNIQHPSILIRATNSINDMVKMIKTLLKKKYAYKASDGIYFSISKSKNYGKLAQLEKSKKSKSRISGDEYDKSNAQDFALWKFHTEADGEVFWDTEIGKGRPGWHIECSAMSTKHLGNHFDIHTGGQDLIFPHHTNEIAQSEAATGEKFVNYWLHGGFLNMKEGKMAKSKGNILTLNELKKNGYHPMHFRYLCLQTHYRKPLNFSFENLDAAKNAYERFKRKIEEIRKYKSKGEDKSKEIEEKFHKAIYSDFNMPLALQIILSAVDDDLFDSVKKLELIEHFDSVFGLSIKEMHETKEKIPAEVKNLLKAREEARIQKRWAEADILRERIKEFGYTIEDSSEGPQLRKM